MAVNIQGGSSTTNVANVDTNYNLGVRTPQTEAQAGFVQLSSEVDAGTVTSTRKVVAPEASIDYRLRVGSDTPLFTEFFAGAAINSTHWASPVTTMTVAVANGFLTLNNGSSVASGAVARVQSYPCHPVVPSYGLYWEGLVQAPFAPLANNVVEFGLGIATGTTAPSDGALFRFNAAGEFRAVVIANSVEIQSGTLDAAALFPVNVTHKCVIQLTTEKAIFWIDDVLVAEIDAGSAASGTTNSSALPILFRTYNTAATASAQQIKCSSVAISVIDANLPFSYSQLVASAGAHATQGQTGQTLGQTANYANSANPTAAVPTNTTAALGSGLGGQYWETDTLAVTTDGVICSYQNPPGTATAPGRVLVITRVSVSSYVQTALTGGGYVAQWCLAYGHSAVSLATAEASASSTKAPRRAAIGVQTVASGATALSLLGTMTQDFHSGLPVNPGEFVQVVKKKVGAAPSAGVVAHVITFDGYWRV